MAKEKVLTAIDIGSYEVKVAIGVPQVDGQVQVMGVASSPSRGIKQGVVININDTLKALGLAISDAQDMAGMQAQNVYCSISGTHIEGAPGNGLVKVRGNEIDRHDVDEALQSCAAIKIESTRELLHSLPQEFIVDGTDGVRDPMGISGVRLESKVYNVTVGATCARNIIKCINLSGSEVKNLIVSPVASSASVLRDDEKELGVLLLDIGAGTTDVIVHKDGAVQFIDVIANAGNNITSALAVNLKTPIAVAENIKKSYSLNSGSFSKKMIDISFNGVGGRTEVSTRTISEMIESKVKDIFKDVKDRVERNCNFPITSVVLCGGIANLRGIDAFAEAVFDAPARIATVREIGGLADLIKDPQYATISGLLKLANSNYSYLRQTPTKDDGPMKIFRKIGNWFCENF